MSPAGLKYLRVPGITGGVNETAQRAGVLPPTDLVAAKNIVPIGAGRVGLRPNLIAGPVLTNADTVVGAIGAGPKVIFIGWDSGNEKYLLYEWDWSTTPLTGKEFNDSGAPASKRWSEGITSLLAISMVYFQGSVFICSTDGTKALAYYSVGDATASIVPALNLSAGADAHATPRWLSAYRNHLFMSGYESEDYPTVLNALRWSKPAAAKTAGDWVSTDFDYVGVEGIPIYSHHPIGRSLLVVLKRDSIHGLYGYKSSNFTVDKIRLDVGSAGPRAATEYLGQIWFWTAEGKPGVLVGGEVVELDEPLRDTLLNYDYSQPDRLWVAAWPRYQAVMFGAPAPAIAAVQEPLLFDAGTKRWLHRHDFPGADLQTLRKMWQAVPVDRFPGASLPGPAAPPSNLQDQNINWFDYESSWTNGDNSPGTTTVLERKEDAPTPGAYADVGTIPVYDPSVFEHTSLTEKAQYTVRARHERNGQSTAVVDRPTKQTKTRCASAPIQVTDEYEVGPGTWRVVMVATGRSGRSGSTSTITLERKLSSESSWSTIKTWAARTDAGSPTGLPHTDEFPCTPSEVAQYRTKVADDGATYADSDYEYTSSANECV